MQKSNPTTDSGTSTLSRTETQTPTLKQRFRRSPFHPLAFGCLTGLVAGGILSLFFLCTKIVLKVSANLYRFLSDPTSPLFWLAIPALFVGLTLCCLVTATIQKLVPTSQGSGIPLVEGSARGIFRPKWLQTLAALFAGSLISFVCGLPLGGEGPSIGIGGMTGEGVGRVFRLPTPHRRYLITGGSCAGLAVAFNAPLTGLAFAFEETHRRFTPQILIAAFSSVVCANIVSRLILGDFTIFPEFAFRSIPLTLLPVAALCGIVCGLVGVAFNHGVKHFTKLFGKIKNRFLRLLPIFLASGVFGLLLADSIGSGELALSHFTTDISFWLLLAFFAIRLVLVVLAAATGATGGLFLPILSIGGILGFAAAKILILCGVDEQIAMSFVMICISCAFAASVRAPITAIILCVELTGSFGSLLPAVLAVAAASVLADLVKCRPLYESMLDRMIEADRRDKFMREFRVTGTVLLSSIVCFKEIRNVLWPRDSLVVSLFRGGEAIVPDGETVLLPGDRVKVKGECESLALFRGQLRELFRLDEPDSEQSDLSIVALGSEQSGLSVVAPGSEQSGSPVGDSAQSPCPAQTISVPICAPVSEQNPPKTDETQENSAENGKDNPKS